MTKDVVISCLYFLILQIFISAIYFRFNSENLGIILFFLHLGPSLSFLIYAFLFYKEGNSNGSGFIKKSKRKMLGIIFSCLLFGLLFLFIEGTNKPDGTIIKKMVNDEGVLMSQELSFELMSLFFFGLTVMSIFIFQQNIKKR
jgi:NADH:ubiquinone oxidoreductase subunit 6 (subunit J)